MKTVGTPVAKENRKRGKMHLSLVVENVITVLTEIKKKTAVV